MLHGTNSMKLITLVILFYAVLVYLALSMVPVLDVYPLEDESEMRKFLKDCKGVSSPINTLYGYEATCSGKLFGDYK